MNAAARESTITLRLDDRPLQVGAGTTLAMLVDRLGHGPDAVATAVNGAFVPRGQREHHRLHDGDAVLLFQPITGG